MGEKYNRASQRAAGGKGRKNTQHFRGQRNTHRQMERKKERKKEKMSIPKCYSDKKGGKIEERGENADALCFQENRQHVRTFVLRLCVRTREKIS